MINYEEDAARSFKLKEKAMTVPYARYSTDYTVFVTNFRRHKYNKNAVKSKYDEALRMAVTSAPSRKVISAGPCYIKKIFPARCSDAIVGLLGPGTEVALC